MLTAAILIGTVLQGQRVTFAHPCAHSTIVLRALGKKVGMTLAPKGSVDKDYFLIRFEDVPIQLALDKIADALNATWEGESTIRFLNRTEKDLAEELEPLWPVIDKFLTESPVEAFPTIDSLSQMIAELNRLDRTKPEDRSHFEKVEKLSPALRALVKFVKLLPRAEIASLVNAGPTVFSESPGEFERPMSPKMREDMQGMRRETATIREAAARTGMDSDPKSIVSQTLRLPDQTEDAHFEIKADFRENSFNLRMNRCSDLGNFYVQEADADGEIRDDRESPLLEGTSVPFQPRPEHQLFLRSIEIVNENRPHFSSLPSFTTEVLLDLENNDPLGMQSSSALLQLAELKKWNIVALLRDGELVPLSAEPASMTLRERLDWILGWHQLSYDQASNFAVVVPMLPRRDREDRWDRNRVSHAFSLARKMHWYDLEARSELVTALHGGFSGNPDLMMSFLFDQQEFGAFDAVDTSALKLYSAIPSSFKKASLKETIEAPLNTFGDDVRRAVLTEVDWSTLGFAAPGVRISRDPVFTQGWGPSTFSDSGLFPAKHRAGKLPDNVLLRLKTDRRLKFVAKPVSRANMITVSGLLDVDEVAQRIVLKWSEPDFSQLALVTEVRVAISIVLPEGIASTVLVSSGPPVTNGFVPRDRLPEPYRTQLRTAIKKHGGEF